MDIAKFLKEAGVSFKLRKHREAYTAQEMAAREHVSGDAVAKAVVVSTGKDYALCVLPASCRVDLGKLGKALKAKKCRLAEEPEMGKLFPDVEIGAEPPFGGAYGLQTVVDERLAKCESITFAAGTHSHAVSMSYADYARLAEPNVADFSVHL